MRSVALWTILPAGMPETSNWSRLRASWYFDRYTSTSAPKFVVCTPASPSMSVSAVGFKVTVVSGGVQSQGGRKVTASLGRLPAVVLSLLASCRPEMPAPARIWMPWLGRLPLTQRSASAVTSQASQVPTPAKAVLATAVVWTSPPVWLQAVLPSLVDQVATSVQSRNTRCSATEPVPLPTEA